MSGIFYNNNIHHSSSNDGYSDAILPMTPPNLQEVCIPVPVKRHGVPMSAYTRHQ